MDNLAAELEAWAWSQSITPEAKLVLLALVRGGEVEPRLDELATRTGLGPYSVREAIHYLIRRRLLTDEFRPVERTP